MQNMYRLGNHGVYVNSSIAKVEMHLPIYLLWIVMIFLDNLTMGP